LIPAQGESNNSEEQSERFEEAGRIHGASDIAPYFEATISRILKLAKTHKSDGYSK
jgi:hypothetical protein